MGYGDRFKEAKEKGTVKDISFNIKSFENPGDFLVGEMVGFEDFQNPKNPTLGKCKSYKFMTDDGPVSCVLGSAADKVMETVRTGDLVRITFIDQLDLGDGRKVNRYNIEVVPFDK